MAPMAAPTAAPTGWAVALVAGLAAAWMMLHGTRAPAHLDTSRDLVMAAECVAGPVCELTGPRASFHTLRQGAVWIELLAVAKVFGWPHRVVMGLVFALFGAAAAWLFVFVWRARGPPEAVLATALWVIPAVVLAEHPIFDNPVLMPLPAVGATVLTLRAVALRRVRDAAWAGLAVGFAMNVHLVGGVLLAILAVAVVAFAARPLASVLAATGMALVVTVLTSVDALLVNVSLLWGELGWVGLVGVAAPLVLASTFRRRQWRRPELWVLVAAGPGYVAVVLALTGGAADLRYFAPALPAVAIGMARVARALVSELPRRLAWLPAMASLFLAVFAGRVGYAQLEPTERAFWYLPDVEALAPHLYQEGVAFQDLYERLRGTHVGALLAGLASHEPAAQCRPAAAGADITVLKVPASEALEGFDVVPLEDDHVALIQRTSARVDQRRARLCWRPWTGGGAEQCEDVVWSGQLVDGCSRRQRLLRRYPEPPALWRSLERMREHGLDDALLTWTLQVRSGEVPRLLQLKGATGCDCCWSLVSVTELEHRLVGGGSEAVLEGGAPGMVRFERRFGGVCPEPDGRVEPPRLVELPLR